MYLQLANVSCCMTCKLILLVHPHAGDDLKGVGCTQALTVQEFRELAQTEDKLPPKKCTQSSVLDS